MWMLRRSTSMRSLRRWLSLYWLPVSLVLAEAPAVLKRPVPLDEVTVVFAPAQPKSTAPIQMTDQQRVASASNTSHVVWNGINVRRAAPKVLLTGAVWLRVLEPASISGDRIAGTAEFGPALAPPGV